MAKKIIFLTSSPRKSSNTNVLVEWAAEAAANCGADIEVVDVASLESRVPGCIACMGCQRHSGFRCMVDDEVQKLLQRIPDFNVVVIATPIYFYGPNAQIKLVLDRWYSMTKPDEDGTPVFAWKNMELALISTAGGSMDDGLALTDKMFRAIAGFADMDYHNLLVPYCPPKPDQIRHDKQWQEKAVAFGKLLAQ